MCVHTVVNGDAISQETAPTRPFLINWPNHCCGNNYKRENGERGREKSQQQNKEQRRAMEGVKKWIIIQLFSTDAAYGDNMMCGWRELTQHMHTRRLYLFV